MAEKDFHISEKYNFIHALRRNCKNFIFNKANFEVECGQFGEKINPI
jgi:hypothetical protein